MADVLKTIQQSMKNAGFYEGKVDGLWGNQSQKAFDALIEKATAGENKVHKSQIAWGAKVSDLFLDKVIKMSDDLLMPPDTGPSDLMACMAWESAETFSSGIKNAAGSGATGLIQFMPATATGMGTTVEALAKLTPEDQLDWVYKYFKPYKGRLKNLGDVYGAILWPAMIGQPDTYVLWTATGRPTTFRQNAGLDVNKDGAITRAECIAKVMEKRKKGLQPQYLRAA